MIETFRNVSLDEPDGSFPLVVDFLECGMAAALWSEPV